MYLLELLGNVVCTTCFKMHEENVLTTYMHFCILFSHSRFPLCYTCLELFKQHGVRNLNGTQIVGVYNKHVISS